MKIRSAYFPFWQKQKVKLDMFLFLLILPILGESIIQVTLGDTASRFLAVLACLTIIFIFFWFKVKLNSFIFILFALLIERVFIYIPAFISHIEIANRNNAIIPFGIIAYFILILFINSLFELNKMKTFFKTSAIIMTIFVLLNFLVTSELTVPNFFAEIRTALNTGYMSRKWLVGHRNQIFNLHAEWILFMGLYYKTTNKDYDRMFIFQIFTTLFVAIYSWNATMMMCSALLFVLYVFRNNLFSRLTIWHYVLCYLLLEIIIVFLRITDYFTDFFVNVLHRNVTFTGRTYVWDIYIEQYSNGNLFNWLFGNFGETLSSKNTHNMFLGLLCYSGGVGLFLYAILVVVTCTRLYKSRNTDYSKFISILLFVFLINSLTMEFYLQILLVCFLGYKMSILQLKFLAI